MPILTAFDNAYFLQSLGWAIGNSVWQAGLLCLVYYLITVNNQSLSAIFKYNLSILFLLASFIWFCFTGFQCYYLLSNPINELTVLAGRNAAAIAESMNKILPFISLAYFTLLAWHAARFIYQFSNTNRKTRHNLTKAPVAIRLFTINTALHLGIKKKVQVWLSANVEVPSVIGFIRPVILLPVAVVNHLDTQQVETILLHELAHIKRRDYLVNLLQSIIDVCLFFNPFALLLSRAIRKERENCCDDWVLNFQYNNHDYAKALLVVEEQRSLPVTLALAATNGKKDLLHRIKRMFTATPQIHSNFFEKLNLAIFASILFIAMIALVPASLKNGHKEITAEGRTTIPAILRAQKIGTKELLLAGNFENKMPLQKSKQVLKAQRKIITEKTVVEETGKDWTEALVNEELLKADQDAAIIATQIAETEIAKTPELLVKIEEEQSGIGQKKTYYFQMKDEAGNPTIKPLLFLNKSKKSPAEKKHTGRTMRKKRITT